MNKSFSHICFDLDGTLVNSGKTILKATAASLQELGIRTEIDENKFVNLIGLHFNDIFSFLKIDIESFDHFISIYKRKYFDYIDLSLLYKDAEELLDFLSEKNTKISLLTTKSQDQADRIIDHFNLRKNFDYVMGRREGIAHKPSPEPLQMICKELNVDLENSLMVGDTELDIRCGKNAGAKTFAVLHGYRTEEQLKKEEPDLLIGSLRELMSE